MSRHFCFCIPVRAGVFLFSLLSTILEGLLAAVLWYIVHEIDIKAENYTNVAEHTKITVIVLAAIFSLMALFSLFGFIGAVGAKRRLVKAFAFMSWLLFFASMGASGLTLYSIFSGKNITSDCIQVDNKGNVSVDSCTTHVSTGVKVAATIIVVLVMIVHLYMVVIIQRYVEQLEEDGAAWQGPYKLTTTDTNQGLLNPQGPYSYAEPHNAYGNSYA